jgi:hypothetical protein
MQPVGAWNVAASDTTAPVISTPLVNVSSNSATIEWLTNELSGTLVTVSDGPSSQFDPTPRVWYTAKVTGLSPGSTYTYSAYSRDQAGRLAIRSGQFRTSDPTPGVVSENEEEGLSPHGFVRKENRCFPAVEKKCWAAGEYMIMAALPSPGSVNVSHRENRRPALLHQIDAHGGDQPRSRRNVLPNRIANRQDVLRWDPGSPTV